MNRLHPIRVFLGEQAWRRPWLVVLSAVGLAVAAAAVLLGLWLPPIPPPPEIAAQGVDPEVVEALNQARAAVLASPRSARAWGALGELFLAHVYHPEAIQCFAQAELLDPYNYRWPYLQGMARLHNDPQSASSCFQRAADRAPSDYVPHLRLAETLLVLERFEEAQASFDRVLRLQPGHPRAYYGKGRAALQRQAFAEAVGYLSLAAENPVSRKAAHQALAELYLREGDVETSQRHARQARALPPDNPWPDPILASVQSKAVGISERLEQARSLFAMGDLAASRSLVEAVLRKQPDNASAYKLLGSIHFRENRPKEAETALREAIRLHPQEGTSLALLGSLLAMQKRYGEAIPILQQAVAVNPHAHEPCFNLAHCLSETGRKQDALAVLEQGLRYRPDAIVLHKALARLFLEQKNAAKAQSVLEAARVLAPDDGELAALFDQARNSSSSP
jgi:tetratricopeptide (TPR) repeat protein